MEDEKNSAREVLAAMGFTPDEVREAQDTRPRRGDTDQRICVCGHSIARHDVVGGIVNCKPSRLLCKCHSVRPVLEAQDTRLFVWKTNGGGQLHALTQGILAHAEREKWVHWIEEPPCDRCKAENVSVSPVPVTKAGHASSHDTGYNVLLCQKCRSEI